MSWQTILYENVDQTARVTLNRPEKRNAQSMRLLSELHEAFKRAEGDAAVRVVVLRGAGKSFSAGHDISFSAEAPGVSGDIIDVAAARSTPEGILRLEQEMYLEKCLAIRNLSKPTIAQVHGHCIAAGMMLAAMCDIIYASEDALFSVPTLRMASSAGEILFEPWDLGPRRAKEFLFTAERITAQDAYRLGFVNKVVSCEALEGEVMALAARIAATPPVAVSLTKASINRTLDIMGQSNAWQQHFAIHLLSHVTAEHHSVESSRVSSGDLKDQFKYQK